MKYYFRVLYCFIGALSVSSVVGSESIEEIEITSALTSTNIEKPLHVLSGDDVAKSPSASLGTILGDLSGVSMSDYGQGVGHPIIRGMSGSRVSILNNGVSVRDVAGLGADHPNEVDMSSVQQIEVIKGPSSLLYSNGAIGGLINIVDDTIMREDVSETQLKVGFGNQSVNDGDSRNISFKSSMGGFNVTGSYRNTELGNYEVPEGAVEHHDEEDHHDEEEHNDYND